MRGAAEPDPRARRSEGADEPLVMSARPDEVLRALDRRLLSDEERQRAAALRHPLDADAYVAAHLLVRWCAATLTGRPVHQLLLGQRCPECGSARHGRPFLDGLPDLHVSLAHARGVVVAGASWTPIGVDVEAVAAHAPTTVVMPSVLTDRELAQVQSSADPSLAFLRHWTRKECLVKLGMATLDTLGRADLSSVPDAVGTDGRTRSRLGALHLVDWYDPSLGAVVAAAGHAPPVVRPAPRR